MRRTALFCLCGAVAGLAAGTLWMPVYTATATLAFVDRVSEPATFDQRRQEFFTAVRAEVLSSESLARHADIRLNENHVCTIRFIFGSPGFTARDARHRHAVYRDCHTARCGYGVARAVAAGDSESSGVDGGEDSGPGRNPVVHGGGDRPHE